MPKPRHSLASLMILARFHDAVVEIVPPSQRKGKTCGFDRKPLRYRLRPNTNIGLHWEAAHIPGLHWCVMDYITNHHVADN